MLLESFLVFPIILKMVVVDEKSLKWVWIGRRKDFA